MTKEEILHLGTLARITLTDEEAEQLNQEIDAILGYVSTVKEIAAEADVLKQAGPVHNIFREDVVTNEPGEYTKALTAEMPATEGPHLKVKKILNPDA